MYFITILLIHSSSIACRIESHDRQVMSLLCCLLATHILDTSSHVKSALNPGRRRIFLAMHHARHSMSVFHNKYMALGTELKPRAESSPWVSLPLHSHKYQRS